MKIVKNINISNRENKLTKMLVLFETPAGYAIFKVNYIKSCNLTLNLKNVARVRAANNFRFTLTI